MIVTVLSWPVMVTRETYGVGDQVELAVACIDGLAEELCTLTSQRCPPKSTINLQAFQRLIRMLARGEDTGKFASEELTELDEASVTVWMIVIADPPEMIELPYEVVKSLLPK